MPNRINLWHLNSWSRQETRFMNFNWSIWTLKLLCGKIFKVISLFEAKPHTVNPRFTNTDYCALLVSSRRLLKTDYVIRSCTRCHLYKTTKQLRREQCTCWPTACTAVYFSVFVARSALGSLRWMPLWSLYILVKTLWPLFQMKFLVLPPCNDSQCFLWINLPR